MMLSIAVFILLVTSAFSLVGVTTELMAEISEAQNASAVRLRFVESCRTAFEATTAKSNLEFSFFDRGGERYDTYLTLVNVPAAFDFGLNRRDEITRVALAAEVRPDGFIRAGIYYFTEADFEDATQKKFVDIDAPYLELVPRMRQLSWQFYDEEREEWQSSLEGDLDASLIELVIKMEDSAPPLRSVFYCLKDG
tara:strand:+ start:532 stop:1116 length:585 start_codon:yes stop_codon:yes gene_type:complete